MSAERFPWATILPFEGLEPQIHESAFIAPGARIIGVNSRNLRTLDVSTAIFDDLAPLLPEEVIAVAESGLKSGDDVHRLRQARYDAFLIGERFMTAEDPGAALAALLDEAGRAGTS